MAEPATQEERNSLTSFAQAVWGKPQAVLKRDHTGVEYIDLSDHINAFKFLFGSEAVRHDKILVREEYRIALQTLETDVNYNNGAYVTGQPGIGKRWFLAYILVARLGKEQTVAWQYSDGRQYHVVFRDEASIHRARDTRSMNEFAPVWGLTISSDDVQSPFPYFGRVKAIQATSPRRRNWKGLRKYANAECYIMDIWSEKEIVDLALLLNFDAERMSFLAKQWGGVPRLLLKFVQENLSDATIEGMYREVASEAVQECDKMVHAVVELDILDDTPSLFYFSRPIMYNGVTRRWPGVVVPTPTLCFLLGETLQTDDSAAKETLFRVLGLAFDSTRQAARFIYENWLHSFLVAARTIECHWVQGISGNSSVQGATSVVRANENAVKAARPPYYWVASNGFPGIDSALVLDHEIYAFQVIVHSEHESPTKGLQRLRDQLPDDLKDIPWRFVYVGDSGSASKQIAQKWASKVSFPTEKVPAAVGWSEVDPVVQGIVLQTFRDEFKSRVEQSDGNADDETVIDGVQ